LEERAVPSSSTYRRILQQGPEKITKQDLADLWRQISEMVYSIEGRRGPVKGKDQLQIDAPTRRTVQRFKGKGSRAVGSVSFSGLNNASMYNAKGAYQNDNGAWIAEDTTAVIMEMNRDSTTPQMYRNEGLQIGQVFTPTSVGYIGIGGSDGSTGGSSGLDDHLIADPAHAASHISFVPYGTLTSVDVQAGMQEIDDTFKPFSRGGTILNPSTSNDIIVWRAPYPCVVTAVKGYRIGGNGATINARRNATSEHLASDLSVTPTDTWVDGGVVQNTSYASGDKLEIRIKSLTPPNPSQVAVQVDYTRS
jgi:hypothetical protein